MILPTCTVKLTILNHVIINIPIFVSSIHTTLVTLLKLINYYLQPFLKQSGMSAGHLILHYIVLCIWETMRSSSLFYKSHYHQATSNEYWSNEALLHGRYLLNIDVVLTNTIQAGASSGILKKKKNLETSTPALPPWRHVLQGSSVARREYLPMINCSVLSTVRSKQQDPLHM